MSIISIGDSLSAEAKAAIKRDAVRLIAGPHDARWLLTCEHASAAVPAPWRNLGLTPAEIAGHIGWDIGAARVTELLAAELGAPAILAGWSRLFVECNRIPEAADFIAPVSDGIVIPGNQALSDRERACRKELAFDPFHARLASLLERMAEQGTPAVVSIHSFTPVMGGRERPWHAGILWKRDSGLARRVHERLNAAYGGPLGYNEPYDANLYETMTIDRQVLPRGLPHVIIEIRNDLIRTEAGCRKWATVLAAVLGTSA